MKRLLLNILLLFLLGVFIIPTFVIRNYSYVLINKAYATPNINYERRVEYFQKAWKMACDSNNCFKAVCQDERTASVSLMLLSIDKCFGEALAPLQVLTDTTQMAAPVFYTGQVRRIDLRDDGGLTMYNAGYLGMRLFPMTQMDEEWTIAVTARHDDPPPVELELWLDEVLIGRLSFDKGDQSWETLSIESKLTPRHHWLYIWYREDVFDEERGLDRNAYIKQVIITRKGKTSDESH